VRKPKILGALIFAVSLFAAAQASNGTTSNVTHTTKAMHYGQVGMVKIPFQGSELMSGATGEAKVEGKKNNIEIDAKFQGL